MEAYRKCEYPAVVINLLTLIRILELLPKAMGIINENLHILFYEYKEEMTARLKKLKRLLEKLKEYEGRELPEEGVTGD